MSILVTGGAGFIGSALVRHLVNTAGERVVNVDRLTYAGNLESLATVADKPGYTFEQVDICDRAALERVFEKHRPSGVIHLAAESHVDRSIDGPGDFIQTNLVGTYTLLETARAWLAGLEGAEKNAFRFLHVSTDEVYGDLEADDPAFRETDAYRPSSPYAATKAGSDHLARAWGRTFDLPVLVSNCSNNYGPNQFPEKLIPHMILNALAGKPLPIYGNGHQVRDWLFVDDHARALHAVFRGGETGRTYNIGGWNEARNIDVVRMICALLEELAPDLPEGIERYHDLITHVDDRPGHDRRYAIDARRIRDELGWMPEEDFGSGLRKTVAWYLDNRDWWQRVLDGRYRLQRLGAAS